MKEIGDNMVPVHYLPGKLCSLMLKEESMGVLTYQPTADGWVCILKCKDTRIEYRIDIGVIKSYKVVEPIYVEDLIEDGGFDT